MHSSSATIQTQPEVASDLAIELQNVRKVYPLHKNLAHSGLDQMGLLKLLPAPIRPKTATHVALDDVNICIKKGERVGIVGSNGAGKTTLLKLISQNFSPTSGVVRIGGKINAIMSTGLGFSPELTGYENIISALEYNGLPESELEVAIHDVVDFCELGDYLHQPFKNYSLGMMGRLQFACATAIKPEILIIDEVLGAGDNYFTAKSAARVKRLADSGCTLLLVSHSMAQVIEFCDRTIWIHNGKVHKDGETIGVVSAYEVFMSNRIQQRLSNETVADGHTDANISDDGVELSDGRKVYRWASDPGPKFDRVALLVDGKPADKATSASALRIECDISSDHPGTFACTYFIHFWRRDGLRVARVEAPIDQFSLQAGERRKIAVDMPPGSLALGDYLISFTIYDRSNGKDTASEAAIRFDLLHRALALTVTSGEVCAAMAHQPTEWIFGETPS